MSSIHYVFERRYGYATSIEFALNAAGTDGRKSSATLAAGDFKIARHTGGVWSVGNPTTTTPTEISTLGIYSLPLTLTELTPDDLQYDIHIACHDVAGAEWDDVDITIHVTRALDTNYRANVGGWNDAAVNALISGRVDANAQVVADKTLYTLTTGEHTQVASDVLNAVAASYNVAGSIGEKINTSGAVADPWTTALPGAYVAGSAGYILGTNLNNTVSSVKAQTDKMAFSGSNILSAPQSDSPGITTLNTNYTPTRAAYLDIINTNLNATISSVSSLTNSVKLKTDNLPADPASASTVATEISSAQSAITAQTDIIKAKTNNLPATPAAAGDQMDLIDNPNPNAILAIHVGLPSNTQVGTIQAALGTWTGTGRNSILGAMQALFRSDVDATVPTDINFNLGSGAGTADNTTDSTQAIADAVAAISGGGSAPTAQQNANAVWDTLRSAHTVLGSFGEGAASVQGNLTGSVASVTADVGITQAGADKVWNTAARTLTSIVDSSGVTTLLTRLSATRAGYLDALAGWSGTLLNAIKALARKDATASTDIGGTHDPATDSEEAIREKVDTLSPGSATTIEATTNELNT